MKKQVRLACTGVAGHVKKSQTETGVKDAYTEPFIAQLIEQARSMQLNQPDRDEKSIQEELMAWVDSRNDLYNEYLTTKGVSY